MVNLWGLPTADALKTARASILPFVPLMKGGQAELEASAQALGQVAEEPLRQRLSLHFVMLGSLRYNRVELLDLLGRTTMVPLHILKETPFYQEIREEGRQEGREEGREEGRREGREEVERKVLIELFRDLALKRFLGLELGSELERVRDLDALKQLCLDLDQIPDEAALRARLAPLIAV
ncbi:MAG: hypothetical protein ACREBD_39470 [Blastocatellia bacterium]